VLCSKDERGLVWTFTGIGLATGTFDIFLTWSCPIYRVIFTLDLLNIRVTVGSRLVSEYFGASLEYIVSKEVLSVGVF
jgi:hypothetical protein